jgi:hypothetical protein
MREGIPGSEYRNPNAVFRIPNSKFKRSSVVTPLPSDARTRRRAFWTTLLDIAIIISASVAAVILLGGRTKLDIGGIQILFLGAWRPAAWAAGFGVLRSWVARGLPPMPSLADGSLRAGIDEERARFASPVAKPRAFTGYAVAVAVSSLVWFTPQLFHIRQVTDPGDPIFSAWRLGRFAHQITHDPRHLFDGNIFYPESRTLTYSDATILQGLVATPFLLAGADPLVVSNVLLLAAFPLCGLAFFYAAWRLTRHLRAAYIAGVLGALHPFHTEHYSHLELQYFCFVPLAIVALLDMLDAPTIRKGTVLGAIISLQWLASMYFGIMLITFLVPFAVLVAAGWRVRLNLAFMRAAAVAVGIVVAALAAVGTPYLLTRGARGDRPYALLRFSSARPSDYGRPHARLASHQWRTRASNSPERELFPGFVTPALALAGMVPPLGAAAAATLVSGALAFDWSLGTNGLTYDELYRWVLPYRGMRVAARFSVFVGTALILLAAYGMERLLRRARGWRIETPAFAVLTVAVLIDLRPSIVLRDYWRSAPSIYAVVTPHMVLAEFPFEPGVDQMYFSTGHGARLLNGYSGFFPESFIRMARQMDAFPDERSLDVLRASGVTHVTINCTLYGRDCGRIVEQLDGSSRVRLVSSGKWEGGDVRLYELIRQLPLPPPVAAPPVQGLVAPGPLRLRSEMRTPVRDRGTDPAVLIAADARDRLRRQ